MGEIETAELGAGAVKTGKSTSNPITVEIILKRIGPSPPGRLTVPSTIKVHDLRKLVAQNGNLNVENLSLVWRGNVLHDNRNGEDLVAHLSDGDSLIVAVKPKPPPKHLRDDDSDSDEEEDEMKFQIPQSIRGWKRRLFIILREKLRFPDMLLSGIFSLNMKTWVFIVLWFILAPFANKYDLGPLFILATGFAIIFYNLGHRQPGDASAYSIFNEDFRELPGTLNADRLDRDIRAGQF